MDAVGGGLEFDQRGIVGIAAQHLVAQLVGGDGRPQLAAAAGEPCFGTP